MIKLVSKVDPFIYTQKVFIYNNEQMISMREVDTPNLAHDLVKICYDYKVEQVDLGGSRLYLNKFVQTMKKDELKNYEKNKLIINIMGEKV